MLTRQPALSFLPMLPRLAGRGRWLVLARAGGIGVLALSTLLAGCVVAPPPPRYRAPPPPAPQPVAMAPMYFYPELRQSEDKQDRDRYECYRWASRETGFDPGMTPVYEVPRRTGVPPPSGAEVAGGAVTGAVVGSVLSSPRHMGQGAVLGALFGAVVGAAAQENQQRAYEHAQAREAAASEAARRPYNNFRRAMTACMEGRGYRVQ